VKPVDKPLALGEVIAETIRIYGERLWPALGIGAVVAGSFVVAVLVRNDVAGVAVITLGFTGAYAAASRLAGGDAFREAWAQTLAQTPALLVLALVVSLPLALGVFDPVLAFFSAFWTAFAGFAIPVTVLEEPEAGSRWHERLAHGMARSLTLARTSYGHAAGVVATLLIVYNLGGRFVAAALGTFADQTGFAAFLLVQVVLAPFFFLGLAVLYFEQRARAVSSRRST
jgi:hypothetical protein